MSNYRSFYGCRALNIESINNKLSNLSGFISGVQNLETDINLTQTRLIDFGGLNDKLLCERNNIPISMNRVIDRSGNFFVKKDVQLFNELSSLDARCPLHNIVAYLGSDNEPIVNENNITSVCSVTNACPVSIEYRMGLRAPFLTESVSFESIKVEYNQFTSSSPQLLPAPETGSLFSRKDYFSHKDGNNPSVLPQLVKELIDYNDGHNEFEGLQEISVRADINYNDIHDIGTWNLNDPYKYRFFMFPLQISTSFIINIKRYPLSSFDNSPDITHDEIKIEYGDFTFNMGPKNRLTEVSFSGGGTDGSIEEVTLTYTNDNVFKIQQREL